MRFAATQKVITFALALVSAFPVMLSGEIGIVWIISASILFVSGWFIEAPLARAPNYRRVVTGIVVVVLAVQLGRIISGEPVARMGMEFAAVLLGLKLCSRGFSADYHQIIILSFLHIISATIATDNLSYAAAFVLFVAISPPVLALTYLRKEMERRFGPSAKQNGPEMLERLLKSKRIVSVRFLVGSSLLSIPILLITAVLFVGFPRIGLGLMGRLPSSQGTAGFGDRVTLGDFDISNLKNTVLLRIELLDSTKASPGRFLPIRLRGTAFDTYEGDTWSHSAGDVWSRIDHLQGRHYLSSTRKAGPRKRMNILLESITPPLLFIPTGTDILDTKPISRNGRFSSRVLESNSWGSIRYNDKARVGLQYRVEFSGEDRLHLTGKPGPADLQVPDRYTRLVALSEDIQGNDDPNPALIAKRFVDYLKNNYTYSLKLSEDDSNKRADNPLDRFLFERKTGYCQHFATGLTLMLRTRGIPARTVTGFFGADWNSMGEFYAVRQRYAHSWTEAWFDGRWNTLDATPSSENPDSIVGASGISILIDAIRMHWHKHVVSFDASSQASMALEARSQWISSVRPALQKFVRNWLVPVIVLLLVGVYILWKKFGSRLQVFALGRRGEAARRRRQHSEATLLYHNLDKRLTSFGLSRKADWTPEEHLASVVANHPDLAEAVGQVVLRYGEVRFGEQFFEKGELAKLKNMVSELTLHERT